MSTVRGSLATALLLVGVAGCTGSPAGASAWSTEADKSLGAVVGSLGTAQVVLEGQPKGSLPHSYAVVTLTDAVQTAEKEAGAFVLSQPPDRLHAAGRRVVTELDHALELLVEVRVEYASPGLDEPAAKKLLDRVRAELKQLDKAQSAVKRAGR